MAIDEVLKLIVAGSIERTAFVLKYTTGIFKPDTRITTGVEFFIKDLTIDGYGMVRLQIWDFGGGERFRFLLPTYVKGANGVFFLYDITNKLTLDHLDDWLPLLRNYDENIPIMLLGTDLKFEDQRTVQKNEAIEVARSRGCVAYLEISIENDVNITQAFETMTKICLDRKYGN